MNKNARITRHTAAAAVALCAGLLISFGRDATWWLLVMAGLAWLQSLRLRREISTSGLPLRIFHIVSWALLGLAVAGLLPMPTRVIGDVVVLLIAAALSIGAGTRRTR